MLEKLEWPFWNAFGNSYVCMHLLVGLRETGILPRGVILVLC